MTGQEFLEQLDCFFRKDEMEEAGDFLQKIYAEAVGEGDVSLQLTVLNEMMGYARSMERESLGIAAVTACAGLIEEYALQNNPSVMTMWINMGTTLCFFDQVEAAFAYYQRAEEKLLEQYARLAALPESTEKEQMEQIAVKQLAAFYNNVAAAYTKKQDYQEAQLCYQKALQLLEAVPLTQEERAVSLGNLAQLYQLWGEVENRQEELQKTLTQLDELLEEEHFQKQAAYREVCRKCAQIYENLGEKERAARLREKRKCQPHLAEQQEKQDDGQLSGLALSEGFWEEIGKPAFLQAFPELAERMCVGLAGEGSECFGFDDAVSRDHDFAPSFCIWLEDEDYERFGVGMQQLYESLPKSFRGVGTGLVTAEGKGRRGVMRAGAFYQRLIGDEKGPETLQDWLFVPEYALAAAVNGAVFTRGESSFLQTRQRLQKGYPEDVRKKKIAARAVLMAQSGQYNYTRCLRHGEEGAAALAAAEFVKHTAHIIYLLNHQYAPYYKWLLRGLRGLPILGEWEQALTGLLVAPNGEKNIAVKQGSD